MSSKKVTLFLFSLSILNCFSQSSLGFDLEINKDFFKITDPGNQVKQSPRINISPGVLYRYTFKKSFTLTTGIRLKDYPGNLTLRNSSMTFASSGNIAFQIPLRLGYNFSLYKNKILVSPVLGGSFNHFLFTDPVQSSGGSKSFTDSMSFSSQTINKSLNFFTVTLGFEAQFRVRKRVSLSIFFHYNRGFNEVGYELIKYTINGSAEHSAVQSTNGTYGTLAGFRLFIHLGKGE